MNHTINTFSRLLIVSTSIFWYSLTGAEEQVADKTGAGETRELNPKFFYFFDGNTIGNWNWSLGDPSNWNMTLDNKSGKSASGKVAVSPASFKAENDGIKVDWSRRKSVSGNLSIYGSPVNLSAVKDTALLAVDMKISTYPNKEVTIGMDCGYPCRSEIPLRRTLKQYPKNEWFMLPIPLNCFSAEDFDFSKVSGPFILSTAGKFSVTLGNIRLERLPQGETGCAK